MEKRLEIANEVFEEQMIPEYINEGWLKSQPEVVYRLDQKGKRYYYTVDEKGVPTFYLSVTTFIRNSLPTSPFLVQWMIDNGNESKDIAEEKANYGTFLHMQCGELLENASYDLDTLPWKLEQYMEKHHLPYSFKAYTDELKRDLLAFAQFVIEKNVVPIAIEIVLTDKERGLAGAIDIVCEMDVEVDVLTEEVFKSGPRAGQRKPGKELQRNIAIVDIKSGRKGFFESAEIQLHQYKRMWEINFPDIKVDDIFNWSPKAWRGSSPTYNLKSQLGAKSARKLDHMVAIAQIEDDGKDNSLTICHGVINIKDGLYSNIDHLELSELVRKRHEPLNMDDTKNG